MQFKLAKISYIGTLFKVQFIVKVSIFVVFLFFAVSKINKKLCKAIPVKLLTNMNLFENGKPKN